MVCQAVTSQTSSMATTVSRNSSNPSLWWGVVNLQQRYNPVIHSHTDILHGDHRVQEQFESLLVMGRSEPAAEI